MAYSRYLTMANKPRIRFKGFTEDWEQRKLSDILKVNSGKDYKHLDQGNIPVYGTGGYMLSVNESLSNIDAIGIGRKGTIDKPQYLKAPFWTVDTLFYLTALDKHSILFLYYLMQLIPWKKFDESTGVPSLSKTTIDNISGFVPSNFQEEELISALFNQLDKSITLHQCKLEKLKLTKKALLQKLFPKNGKHIPEIRFKGFTDAWEQRKLSDISTKVTRKNVNVHYTETLTNSAEQGIISQVDFFDKEISNKDNINGYYIVDNNDFIYNPRISTLAPVGPINRNKLNRTGIMSPLYTVFRSSNVDLGFLEWYFQSSHWHRYMKLKGDSGARADRIAIKDSTFFEMPIKIPVNIKEQVLIGETLEKFNQYITLHQRKLERLQEVKKGLLQKMFV